MKNPLRYEHKRGESEAGAYFDTMARMQAAIRARKYADAADCARRNLDEISSFVRSSIFETGALSVSSIPVLRHGGTMLALAGDVDALVKMKKLVESTPELACWRNVVDAHLQDLQLLQSITAIVEEQPGIRQTKMKEAIGESNGRRVATLIAWLEKAGRIERVKSTRTYVLWKTGSLQAKTPSADLVMPLLRRSSGRARVQEIDLSILPYVPLPRAPLRWENRDGVSRDEPVPEDSEPFEVHDASGWSITSITKIPMPERPDSAFRRFHPVNDGIILLDDLGNAEAYPHAAASALRIGRNGERVVIAPLAHDIYRLGVNALGRGLIAMSSDCVLHAYDTDLHPLFESPLQAAPEVAALCERLGIQKDRLKNHLRTVSLAHDNSRFLVTGVDEAWCLNANGTPLWSARLPLQEGWTKISTSSDVFGSGFEIRDALEFMDLALPITPEAVKGRYRILAKQWHPDLNPSDPQSTQRMQTLTAAAELLTGLDLARELRDALPSFVRNTSEHNFEAGGVNFGISLNFGGGEVQAADWIYAAGMGGRSLSAFLAGYSGKIVQIDEKGDPVRAYDIGAVPRRIIDTGDFLYFLTATRLYVLRENELHALVDTVDQGELIVAHTGFGLVEKKRFRWFQQDGEYIGSVITDNPIRRVYSTKHGLVVETRQRRAVISSAPYWWD